MSQVMGYEFDNTFILLSEEDDTPCNQNLSTLIQVLFNQGQSKVSDSILVSKLSHKELVIKTLAEAYFELHNRSFNTNPIEKIEAAYTISKKEENYALLKLSILAYLELYSRSNTLPETSFLKFLEEYQGLASSASEFAWYYYYQNLYYGKNISGSASFDDSAIKMIEFYHQNKSNLKNGIRQYLEEGIGQYYRTEKMNDSASYYLNKFLAYPDQPFLTKKKFTAHLGMAATEMYQEEFDEAKIHFERAQNFINKADTVYNKSILNRFKSEYYYAPQKQYDSAYIYYREAVINLAKLDLSNNNLKITELNERLQTAQKEEQILIEKNQKERNRNIAYGLGGGVVAVSLIGFLLFTNSRRKQRIAEQQSEIEIQKTEKILKEQELTTIDAMISGQEKERQRLASDLHDSVGATLAAAKLQFDHLSKNRDKPQEMEPLYDKTAQLLEDAYTEVRSLAHAKNSGVIAKNGLLPAVQQLARNASGTSTLIIEVEDFGLDERIENSLEISIFRMIQELVTNMIKHAEATSASISITQHEESLNIILEDNGKGFDPKKVITKDGMGLSSIERRIEHLEGSFEVDSTIGKGTTIIIDIPL